MEKFIDTVSLKVVSGNGAPGSTSFRREKYIPRGGPDGGDGGKGGDVVLHSNRSVTSFSHIYPLKKVTAEHGEPGSKQQRHGSDGKDYVIQVPVGTIVRDTAGVLIHDFIEDDMSFVLVRGGLGGRGNVHFATSVNQAPRYAQKGQSGEELEISMEIKLIADIGLVGLPNAGKSTFISAVTNARPKIAPYPFTTLAPKLGIYRLDIENTLVISDIPGIIEGAHEGKGVGLDFLRHIERTFYLFFLIDATVPGHYETFQKLRHELKSHSSDLYNKEYRIGISKIDMYNEDTELIRKQFPAEEQERLIFFSSLSKQGLDDFKKIAYGVVKLKKAAL